MTRLSQSGLAALCSFTATLLVGPHLSFNATRRKNHVCVKEGKFVQNCGDLKIFTGTSHTELAGNIAKHLGTSIQPATVGRFNDGEVAVKVSKVC